MTLDQIFADLGMPSWVADLASARLACPGLSNKPMDFWYGTPPSLIPILVNDSLPWIYGLLNHPFSRRPPTFCCSSIESGAEMMEIARTPAQFATYLAIDAFDVSSEVEMRDFAAATGISFDEISAQYETHGSITEDLIHLPAFATYAPVYDGDPRPTGGNGQTAPPSSSLII